MTFLFFSVSGEPVPTGNGGVDGGTKKLRVVMVSSVDVVCS